LTGELLELGRVLRLLAGELLRLPRERWVLGLTCLTRERCWRGLAGKLDRLPRQLAWILKLAGVLGLLPWLNGLPRNVHRLAGLRGI
jgi:hypothetical protein